MGKTRKEKESLKNCCPSQNLLDSKLQETELNENNISSIKCYEDSSYKYPAAYIFLVSYISNMNIVKKSKVYNTNFKYATLADIALTTEASLFKTNEVVKWI